MKSKRLVFFVKMLVFVIAFITACNSPTDNSEELLDIEIFSSSMDTSLTRYLIAVSDSTVVSISEGSTDEEYCVIIRRDGYFTKLVRCHNGETISLEQKPVYTDRVCGVVFVNSKYQIGTYDKGPLNFCSTGLYSVNTRTDKDGIFGLFLKDYSNPFVLWYRQKDSLGIYSFDSLSMDIAITERYMDIFLDKGIE